MSLDELRQKIQAGSGSLQDALKYLEEIAWEQLSTEEKQWLRDETTGYDVAETIQEGAPSGMVSDEAQAHVPNYRKFTPTRAIALMTNGKRLDVTNTLFGQMPHIEILSIKALEDNVLPLIATGQEIGVRTIMPEGDRADRFLNPQDVLDIFQAVRQRAIAIINRLS